MDDTLYIFLGLIVVAILMLSLAYFIWFITTLNSIKEEQFKTRMRMEEIIEILDDCLYEDEATK